MLAKTANFSQLTIFNNSSLSMIFTATDQKLQKIIKGDITHHHMA